MPVFLKVLLARRDFLEAAALWFMQHSETYTKLSLTSPLKKKSMSNTEI